MVLEKIYVARHGYRANWLPPPHAPNPTGIDSDPPLAPYGVEQAKELANFIVNSPLVDPKPELIFSSPFYRCVETSTPLANAIDVPIFVERGIGEWYKKDRGVIPEPASLELLKTFFGRVSADWDPKTVVPSLEGEDESDIFARCQEFFPKFLSKFEAAYPQVKTVMFVTHAATKIALGMAILKYTGVRELLRKEHGGDGKTVVLRAGTCSLDSYSRNGDSWSLGFNGETSFLEKGEEMNWHFCELFLKLLRSLVEIYAFGVTTNLLPILADTYEAGSDEDIAERARLAAAAAAAKSESVDVDDKAGDFLESEEELEVSAC
ncbi:unnamed protein product [Kuraishia capsulata CBS 1993]|uniref:Transcription factor TFIIIC triple barrel domain-containing protein n=1 Tax=Kuraishia capsulata CBS 1993 TaxID=1382522 RepID=W6MQN8_9ASCO|nr:uncharacterized protein KUCA_T00005036001 [Kuraishia capsulata CBS 1993]CDK29049.1 unnamed protein product [Kuraishia capsulata CBS 1993]